MTASETPGVDRSLRIRQAITIAVIVGLCVIAWRNQVVRNKADETTQAEAATAKEFSQKTNGVEQSQPNDEPSTRPTKNVEIDKSRPEEKPIERIESETSESKKPAEQPNASNVPAKSPPPKTTSEKSSGSNVSSEKPSETKVKTSTSPPPKASEEVKVASKPKTAPPPEKKATPEKPKIRTKIDNQTIRNEDGEVVFRGTVDLGDTIERVLDERVIERFRHDGITFQNRERKLPNKPPGYYREWVHPTAGLGGPGPQRIISGEGGELYYTPNHYISFIKLN